MHNPPTHDEISRRAYQLWHEYGSPAGRDADIWLNAERQLKAKAANADPVPAAEPPTAPKVASAGGRFAERVMAETAAESVVEHHISPAIPDQDAIQAALQKQAARAPQVPHHTGLHALAPVSGKPLYDRPHSS